MTNIHPLRPTRKLATVEIVADRSTYRSLLETAHRTRRCPAWVVGYGVESFDPRWSAAAHLEELDTRDPEEMLAEYWPGGCDCPVDCVGPYGERFPGLTPRPPVEREVAVEHASAIAAELPLGDLVVVPAARPADILAATGWTGSCNHHHDVVGLSAVLRSWEDRFGALLVRLGRAELVLAVAEPPRSADEALRVAAEHWSFCCDAYQTYTGQMSADTLRQYAARIIGKRSWRFWWD